MSLKFKLLEDRVTELERQTCRMYKALKMIQEATGVDLMEVKEVLAIPPADPDLRQEFEKKPYSKKL